MLPIQENVALAPLTTFKIGGPARYFTEVSGEEEIKEALLWANPVRNKISNGAREKNLPIFVLAGGSNLLISDKGFDGLVIKIQNCKLSPFGRSPVGGKIENCLITAEAGVPLAKLVAETAKAGLSGLEWAVGIPGTVGGAVANNTGAFGRDVSSLIEQVRVLDGERLEIKELNKSQCQFDYRQSRFKGGFRPPGRLPDIILSAVLRLKRGNPEEIHKVMRENIKVRPQNVGGKSAGCFFKNIPWETSGLDKEKFIKKFPRFKKFESMPRLGAGSLIDSLGLKGFSVNDAAVSKEHAAYIINKGSARAEDVMKLAELVRKKVREYYGLNLENEVEIIGFLSSPPAGGEF